MTIIRFSKDEVEKLRKDIQDKKEEIDVLEGKTPSQIWDEELEELVDVYDKWETECDAAFDELIIKKKIAAKEKIGHNIKKNQMVTKT
jgi:DNA topoisomerase-2